MRTAHIIIAISLIGILLISAIPKKKKHFPKFKLDRESMIVYSHGKDWIQDVTMYKWKGELPDSIPDTLRFFTNNAVEFSNENIWNRMSCSQLSWKLGEETGAPSDSLGMVVEEIRDSLETVYPAIEYHKLGLLTDRIMRFDSTGSYTSPPSPLGDYIDTECWYLFDVWHNLYQSHGIYQVWYLTFYLDENGAVRFWLNQQREIEPINKGVRWL